jgi:hypothetical protein
MSKIKIMLLTLKVPSLMIVMFIGGYFASVAVHTYMDLVK